MIGNAVDAPYVLKLARDLITSRGEERDKPEGERSMARAVAMFNAKYDTKLSEEQGWCFMVFLKHSRMVGGAFKLDDYLDATAYEALMAEAAVKEELQQAEQYAS